MALDWVINGDLKLKAVISVFYLKFRWDFCDKIENNDSYFLVWGV